MEIPARNPERGDCMARILSFTKPSRLALAGGNVVWMLAATAALAQPTCTTHNGGVYPCTIGGTLLAVSKPSGSLFGGGGGSGGGGGGGFNTSFIEDPQKP